MNTATANKKWKLLSLIQKKVYRLLHGELYGEPGFSDVELDDIVDGVVDLGKYDESEVVKAVGQLIKIGLVTKDDDDCYHTVEHSNEIIIEKKKSKKKSEEVTNPKSADAEEEIEEMAAKKKTSKKKGKKKTGKKVSKKTKKKGKKVSKKTGKKKAKKAKKRKGGPGRPVGSKNSTGCNEAKVQTTVEQACFDKLEAIAERKGISMASIVRKALYAGAKFKSKRD